LLGSVIFTCQAIFFLPFTEILNGVSVVHEVVDLIRGEKTYASYLKLTPRRLIFDQLGFLWLHVRLFGVWREMKKMDLSLHFLKLCVYPSEQQLHRVGRSI